jgi:hypothetical protein
LKIKSSLNIILIICFIFPPAFCQEKESRRTGILFHGLVLDANTFLPVASSQIMINRVFSSVSSDKGTFAFFVNRNDTVIFNSLGYKPTIFYVSDTLTGSEFITGVYMQTDTLSIGEVIIIPRFTSLKSEIMNARSKTSTTMENARYNVAVSAYQGRNSQNELKDPASNYEIVRYRQKLDAYERGGIPSDKMLGISPLLLIPAAYLLIHGLPEKPEPFEPQLTDRELDQIQKKYFETLEQRK